MHPALFLALGVPALFVAGLAAFTAYETRRITRAFPAEGEFVEVDGARLHYVDRGTGPVIVLLHGLAGQWRQFHYLVDRLAADHRVILVDRPGSGYSTTAPGASHGIRAQADFIAGLIRRLGLDRPLLVGHSMGGALALALALDHPENVGGLALIGPLTHPVESAPAAFRHLAIRSRLVRLLVAYLLVAPLSRLRLREEETLRFVFAPEERTPDFETRCGTPLILRPQNFLSAVADLSVASDDLPAMVARYPGIQVPVRVLFGRGDAILDYRLQGEKLAAAVPGLRLDVVAGGHMLPMTVPDFVADWIKAAERVPTAPAGTLPA